MFNILTVKMFKYILVAIAFIPFVISCSESASETLFASQIDHLEDDPAVALEQMDTTGLQKIQTTAEAIRYLMKSLAEHYIQDNHWPDEYRMQQCIRLLRDNKSYEPLLEALYLLSNKYESEGRNEDQIASIEEAIALAQKKNDSVWLFFLYDNLSYMYLRQYNTLKYYKYQRLANKYIKSEEIHIFNLTTKILIGKNYLYLNKNKEAIAILESVNNIMKRNHIYYTYCQSLLGLAYIKGKQWEKGIQVLEESLEHVKDEENKIKIYMVLTDTYYQMGDKLKAVGYKEKIDVKRLPPTHYLIKKDFYKTCIRIAYEEKAITEVFVYGQLLHKLNEEVIKNLNARTLDEVILQYEFRKDRRAKARYEKKLYLLIGSLVISVCGVGGLFLWKKRKYIRQKWELAQQIEIFQRMNDESERMKNELKKFIVRDFEIAKRIALLNNVQTDSNRAFVSKLHSVFAAKENEWLSLNWDKFYKHINIYRQNFYTKLIEVYPALSEKEVQLCCMLIAGFNTNEIAAVWSQSVYSVHKCKTNIRKKTGLSEGADIAMEFTARFGLQG